MRRAALITSLRNVGYGASNVTIFRLRHGGRRFAVTGRAPLRALFDKIGIRTMVMDTDPYGNFLTQGYELACGRDWARLGKLARGASLIPS